MTSQIFKKKKKLEIEYNQVSINFLIIKINWKNKIKINKQINATTNQS